MTSEAFDQSSSIATFLDAAAAKRPAPGGGSVTALVGALAAAVGEMVLNYSTGKKGVSSQDDQKLHAALAELTRARSILIELMIEDQGAFAALSAARKQCDNAGDREPAFAAALLACIRIPQAVGTTAAAMLELCGGVSQTANKFLLSDLAVCAELSMATIRCAAYNVFVNLNDVSDPAERDRFDKATAEMVARATSSIRQIVPQIWERMS